MVRHNYWWGRSPGEADQEPCFIPSYGSPGVMLRQVPCFTRSNASPGVMACGVWRAACGVWHVGCVRVWVCVSVSVCCAPHMILVLFRADNRKRMPWPLPIQLFINFPILICGRHPNSSKHHRARTGQSPRTSAVDICRPVARLPNVARLPGTPCFINRVAR